MSEFVKTQSEVGISCKYIIEDATIHYHIS